MLHTSWLRKLLEQERQRLAEVRANVDQRFAVADARLAKAETKQFAADQARSRVSRRDKIVRDKVTALPERPQTQAPAYGGVATLVERLENDHSGGGVSHEH
ncbi:hypothetical protein [Lacipirellula sp.]|uniref:hypothetical protein n=1 Tax=Lacipirellula sp. TaxID=2691419 RepID=UPI003D0BABB7